MTIAYLTISDLVQMANRVVGGQAVLRDPGLLDSAVSRPRSTVFGQEAYPDLHTKVAALAHSIVCSHPLVDGNKRLGLAAIHTMYLMNGMDISPAITQEERRDLILGIAEGALRDVNQIAKLLASWVVPMLEPSTPAEGNGEPG